MSYYELWNVMSQWKAEFTTREFAATFVSPDPNKVLHDMSRKGMLEKTGRGRYKVIPQNEYVKKRTGLEDAYEIVERAGLPYAFTKGDAVLVWTKGGYNAGRFFGYYPVMLRVARKDLKKWENYFRSEKKRFVVEGSPLRETLYGVFYQLQPVDSISKTTVEGYSVDSLDETVNYCRENQYTYLPALEMLDEMYRLGLNVKYSET